jgi:hypothetical protein
MASLPSSSATLATLATSNLLHPKTIQNIQGGPSTRGESPAISPRSEPEDYTFAGGMLGFKTSRKKAAAENAQNPAVTSSKAFSSSRISLQPRTGSVETVQLGDSLAHRQAAPNPATSGPSMNSAPPAVLSATARSSVS